MRSSFEEVVQKRRCREIQQADRKYNLKKCFPTVRFTNRKFIVPVSYTEHSRRRDCGTGDIHRASPTRCQSRVEEPQRRLLDRSLRGPENPEEV